MGMISACNSTPYETAAKVQKNYKLQVFYELFSYKIHDWNISLMVIVFFYHSLILRLSFAYPCVAQSND